ncbi:MAG TPA: hypothetical protein VKY19_00045, partial [Ktedonosporobacter sp.]|nr:hypothetical protein [Ktedonosporobacter sp.]
TTTLEASLFLLTDEVPGPSFPVLSPSMDKHIALGSLLVRLRLALTHNTAWCLAIQAGSYQEPPNIDWHDTVLRVICFALDIMRHLNLLQCQGGHSIGFVKFLVVSKAWADLSHDTVASSLAPIIPRVAQRAWNVIFVTFQARLSCSLFSD